jgi:sec-independent protein translocase protein TatA
MLGSPIDLALIATVALVVFGPKKLPELGKSLGLGLANFKKAVDLKDVIGPAVTPEESLVDSAPRST